MLVSIAVILLMKESANGVCEPFWMEGRVEGVGGEDEVERVRLSFVVVSIFTIVTVTGMDNLVSEGIRIGFIIEIRPIERGGRDGAGSGQVRVVGDVAGQVWEDVGEVCEVDCGLEEGGSGDADEARAGAEF